MIGRFISISRTVIFVVVYHCIIIIKIMYTYSVMQSDRNRSKTDTFHEPTAYEPARLEKF